MNEARGARQQDAQARYAEVLGQAVTLASIVGGRVRELRDAAGLTQDQLIERLARWGLDWPRSVLTKIEGGVRDTVTPEHLALLAVVLGVTPADLVTTGRNDRRWVRLGTGGAMRAGAFAALLVGGGNQLKASEVVSPPYEAPRWTTDVTTSLAAKRLDADPATIDTASMVLWGRRLPGERDWRLVDQVDEGVIDKRSRQALRGHITRRLVDELRANLDKIWRMSASEVSDAIEKSVQRAKRQEQTRRRS